jgi:hypothetical protein
MLDKNVSLKPNTVELFISYGISALGSESLKNAFYRERPADRYPDEVFVVDLQSWWRYLCR